MNMCNDKLQRIRADLELPEFVPNDVQGVIVEDKGLVVELQLGLERI